MHQRTRIAAYVLVGVVGCLTARTSAAQQSPTSGIDNQRLIHVPMGVYRPFFKQPNAARSIPVAEFWMDAAPVTRSDYLDFVRRNPAWRKSQVKQLFAEDNYLSDWIDDLHPSGSGDSAVIFVSWFAARAYCAERDNRLPTVAEWERVAGSSNGNDNSRETSAIDNSAPFRFAMGQPAADMPARTFVFGNTWEWTVDFNSALAAGGDNSTNIRSSLFCGDGFRSNDATDYAAFLRYSFRSSLRGNYTLKNLGFRCAR